MVQDYKKIIFSGLLVVFLLSLSGYSYVGFSSLMMADDYCFLSVLGEDGFLKSQIDTYTNIVVIAGNRYAATVTISILGYFGEKLITIFPLIMISSLFFSFTFVIYQIYQYFLDRKEILLSAVMAAFLTNILLYIAPSHFQNIYWYSGVITYTTPLVVFVFLIGVFFYSLRVARKPAWIFVLMVVLAFLSAGYSETAAVAFFACVSLLFAFLILFEKREKFHSWKFTPIIGITIGLVLLIISPAGRTRASSTNSVDITQFENGLWILTTSFRFGFDIIKYKLSGFILPMIVSMIGFASFGYLARGKQEIAPRFAWKQILTNIYIILTTYFIVAASVSPSVFAFSTFPNLRSRMVGTFFLLVGVGLIAFYSGYHFPPRSKIIRAGSLAALICISVYVLRASWIEQSYKTELQNRRDQWIIRNELVEQSVLANEKQVTVFGIDSIETVEDFNPVCFRKYYGPIHVEEINE